jgi:RNA polymerase sigma factor (TIGR02999 family)
MASPHDVTRLLKDWANGDQSALEALTPVVYGELRRLAAGYLRKEAAGHTLQPTALVHEAFIRLVGRTPDCKNRSHFYGVAAHLMRQILVDYFRKKGRGRFVQLPLVEDLIVSREKDPDLVALDEALQRLAAVDPRKALVVEMRFFGGLGVQESAEALNVSEVTVRRDWVFAKTWLLRDLREKRRNGS